MADRRDRLAAAGELTREGDRLVVDAQVLRRSAARDQEHVEIAGLHVVEGGVGLLRIALLAGDLALFGADDRHVCAGILERLGRRRVLHVFVVVREDDRDLLCRIRHLGETPLK